MRIVLIIIELLKQKLDNFGNNQTKKVFLIFEILSLYYIRKF